MRRIIRVSILTILVMMSNISFGQVSDKSTKTYMTANSEIVSAPMGMGLLMHGESVGFYLNVKFRNSQSGESIEYHENSGVYQIGSCGNRLTGHTNQYSRSILSTYSFGLVKSILKSDDNTSQLLIYSGINLLLIDVDVETYYEAEDVSSVYNVLGYYWLGEQNEFSNTYIRGSVGLIYEYKRVMLGVGYVGFNHSVPSGVDIMFGIRL